ncbi:leucine-rich repeat domain-containing protein [Dyadobacter crusticola]|uniref:leucine-rich repeat domain-containing protein n=1 Tax=Dyadobacter crusticola TaxID=292407 RepID=UPI0005510B0C|nr:T9SS type A sorting domain-containing protein [Dyadobacter crusticola]
MKKLLTFILLLSSFNTYSQTLEQDRLALVAVYNAANGVGWPGNNWVIPGAPGDNPCGWSGVGCEGGRVTSLDISGDELKGTLPAEIGSLTALKKLLLNARFSSTHLTGNLPIELGNLINLEELDIAGHAFGITNADVIGNLVNLKTLWFTPLWPIPEKIFTLANVETLVLSLGQAAYPIFPIGPVPTSLMNMTSLRTLIISNMGFTGQLPTELGNLTNLRFLSIGESPFLEGKLPSSIGNLTNLKQLSISRIQNAGSIPPEIGKLTNLTELILYNNAHTGTIPEEINNLVNATKIVLDYGNLTGPLPDLSGLKPGILSIENNNFNFTGIEGYTDRYYSYKSQKEIPIIKGDGYFYVNAGGTLSKNTYKWYLNGMLDATNVGDPKYTPSGFGQYHAEVTNADVPNFILPSDYYSSPLPVTLITFDCKADKGQNKLTWQTTSETSNKGFEIERSADARTFNKIGYIEGSGDSKAPKNYTYSDQNPFSVTYYRLKQLDYNGDSEYSKIIMVKNEAQVSVYPNPASEYLTISGLEREEDVLILSQTGKVVLKQKALSTKPVNVKALPNGFYTLKVNNTTKRIVITK